MVRTCEALALCSSRSWGRSRVLPSRGASATRIQAHELLPSYCACCATHGRPSARLRRANTREPGRSREHKTQRCDATHDVAANSFRRTGGSSPGDTYPGAGIYSTEPVTPREDEDSAHSASGGGLPGQRTGSGQRAPGQVTHVTYHSTDTGQCSLLHGALLVRRTRCKRPRARLCWSPWPQLSVSAAASSHSNTSCSSVAVRRARFPRSCQCHSCRGGVGARDRHERRLRSTARPAATAMRCQVVAPVAYADHGAAARG